MKDISFSDIHEKLLVEATAIDADIIVAVARGGLVPAAILSGILNLELRALWLQMYEDGHMPPKKHDNPKLLQPFTHALEGKKVLLVDDFSHTGETLEKATELLLAKGAAEVKTLVVAGKDALFPSDTCVKLPWHKSAEEDKTKNGA